MDAVKKRAIKTVNELYRKRRIGTIELQDLVNGIANIETLNDRDKRLEEMWERLADVPVDPVTETLDEAFLCFPAGADKEAVWRWFDERYSKGVAYLLYGGTEDYVPESKRLYALKKKCSACTDTGCAYNHKGECRFALVHEREPDPSSCIGYFTLA